MEHGNFRLTEAYLSELDADGTIATKVPVAAIRSISPAAGFTAERMMVLLVIGLLLYSGALAGAVLFFFHIGGTKLSGHMLGGLFMLTVIGATAIATALRRGEYLRIETNDGDRKLVIASKTEIDGLLAMLVQAGLPVSLHPNVVGRAAAPRGRRLARATVIALLVGLPGVSLALAMRLRTEMRAAESLRQPFPGRLTMVGAGNLAGWQAHATMTELSFANEYGSALYLWETNAAVAPASELDAMLATNGWTRTAAPQLESRLLDGELRHFSIATATAESHGAPLAVHVAASVLACGDARVRVLAASDRLAADGLIALSSVVRCAHAGDAELSSLRPAAPGPEQARPETMMALENFKAFGYSIELPRGVTRNPLTLEVESKLSARRTLSVAAREGRMTKAATLGKECFADYAAVKWEPTRAVRIRGNEAQIRHGMINDASFDAAEVQCWFGVVHLHATDLGTLPRQMIESVRCDDPPK